MDVLNTFVSNNFRNICASDADPEFRKVYDRRRDRDLRLFVRRIESLPGLVEFVEPAFGFEDDPFDELANAGQVVDHADDLPSGQDSSVGVAVHKSCSKEHGAVRRHHQLCVPIGRSDDYEGRSAPTVVDGYGTWSPSTNAVPTRTPAVHRGIWTLHQRRDCMWSRCQFLRSRKGRPHTRRRRW